MTITKYINDMTMTPTRACVRACVRASSPDPLVSWPSPPHNAAAHSHSPPRSSSRPPCEKLLPPSPPSSVLFSAWGQAKKAAVEGTFVQAHLPSRHTVGTQGVSERTARSSFACSFASSAFT